MGDGRDPTVVARFLLDNLLLARCVHGRWCSSSMVVNDPVIMRYSGSAPDSGHRELGGPSSSQQRQVFDSAFSTHFASFFALLRLSRS